MSKIGINGFGKVGRMALHAAMEKHAIVVAINDPTIGLDFIIYFIKFTLADGPFNGTVCCKDGKLVVNGRPITIFHEDRPEKINWAYAGAKYIIETTKKFANVEEAAGHFNGGAKKVVIATDKSDAPMFVYGANLLDYEPNIDIISTGSSFVNGLAPIIKFMEDNYGIIQGSITTMHGFVPKEKQFNPCKPCDPPKLRKEDKSIVPVPTFGAEDIEKVIPSLNQKISSMVFRVPTKSVSCANLVLYLRKSASFDEIMQSLRDATHGPLKGILDYTDGDDMFAVNFTKSTHSSILDIASSKLVNNNFVTLVLWFDNEYGLPKRIIDVIKYMQVRDYF